MKDSMLVYLPDKQEFIVAIKTDHTVIVNNVEVIIVENNKGEKLQVIRNGNMWVHMPNIAISF